MQKPDDTCLAGTTIAVGGKAVLLRGPMRCGKSDLALRCMALGAQLVSDSLIRVKSLQKSIGVQDASPVPGIMDISGIGTMKVDTLPSAILVLVIDLVPQENVPRHPKWENIEILGLNVPRLYMHAFDAAAPQKIYAALKIVNQPDLLLD